MFELELRYRGELLGHHASEEAARSYLKAHYANVKTQGDFTIASRRPVELYCRGNLVDTFHTHAAAQARITGLKPAHKLAMPPEVWEIVDRKAGERPDAEVTAQEREEAARAHAEAAAGDGQ
jgi:hypothetical protein